MSDVDKRGIITTGGKHGGTLRPPDASLINVTREK